MMTYVFAYRNKLGGFYGKLFQSTLTSEVFIQQFQQEIFNASDEMLDSMSEDELYYLGTFDNLSGVFVSCNEYLLDCSALVKQAKVLKKAQEEVSKDVK